MVAPDSDGLTSVATDSGAPWLRSAWPPGTSLVRTYDLGMSSDAVPEAVVPVQLDPQLAGQLSINDILLELGQAPVVHPSPDAASELHFF